MEHRLSYLWLFLWILWPPGRSEFVYIVKESKKRKRKKKKKPEDLRGQEHLKQFSKFSSGSESGEEEDDGEDIEEEVAETGDQDDLFKSDHEFSCESDVPDDDWQPVKHARTATKVSYNK